MTLSNRQREILMRIKKRGGQITTRTWRDVHPFSITDLCTMGYLKNVDSVKIGKRKYAAYELTAWANAEIERAVAGHEE